MEGGVSSDAARRGRLEQKSAFHCAYLTTAQQNEEAEREEEEQTGIALTVSKYDCGG